MSPTRTARGELRPMAEDTLLATPRVGKWLRREGLETLLRERCRRLAAPEALRQRILTSLPHRNQAGLD